MNWCSRSKTIITEVITYFITFKTINYCISDKEIFNIVTYKSITNRIYGKIIFNIVTYKDNTYSIIFKTIFNIITCKSSTYSIIFKIIFNCITYTVGRYVILEKMDNVKKSKVFIKAINKSDDKIALQFHYQYHCCCRLLIAILRVFKNGVF